MPEYRRAFVPGGTFFFTVVTFDRTPILCAPVARDALRCAVRAAQARWAFDIDAIVLLPDHVHTIWTLPNGDHDFSARWGYLKKEFTKTWLSAAGVEGAVSRSKQRNRRRGVWQRRFWEHTIRDDADFQRHCDYIHYNPVKHRRADCPHGWPYSSFSRWVQKEVYGADWQCACNGRRADPPRFADLDETAME